jgi:hypothetical protein
MNAGRVSMHEVDVGMSLGKLVPLGRLQDILKRRSSMHLVQPVPVRWNVMESKYLPRCSPGNDLMQTTDMWETSHFSSFPLRNNHKDKWS